jgi:quercetin dioxygenase-like cupin family protein
MKACELEHPSHASVATRISSPKPLCRFKKPTIITFCAVSSRCVITFSDVVRLLWIEAIALLITRIHHLYAVIEPYFYQQETLMATHHASPFEIVNLATWAQDLPSNQTKAIVKTQDMELARLVFPAGTVFSDHKVSGPIVVHCIEGEIEFTAMGEAKTLQAGELLYLMPNELHAIRAITDAVVLLTIIFKA